MNPKNCFDILYIGDDSFLMNEFGSNPNPFSLSIIRVSTYEEFQSIIEDYEFKLVLFGFEMENYAEHYELVQKIKNYLAKAKTKSKLYIISSTNTVLGNKNYKEVSNSSGILEYLNELKANINI